MPDFASRLSGGHPNSLGQTVTIVEEVLAEPALFDELFQCYFSEDETVRLRVSVAQIDQASAQWTLSQLFLTLEKDLSPAQRAQAQAIMQRNLSQHSDWIVLTQTMQTLTRWAKRDEALRHWLRPQLERHAQDPRKSVSGKAQKCLKEV